jgi:hypothetical protein
MDLAMIFTVMFLIMAGLFCFAVFRDVNKTWGFLPLALAGILLYAGPSYLDTYKWHETEDIFTATAIPGIRGVTFSSPVKIKRIIKKREKCYAEIWNYVVLIDGEKELP